MELDPGPYELNALDIPATRPRRATAFRPATGHHGAEGGHPASLDSTASLAGVTADGEWDLDDITVTVDAPAVTARIPLRDWMRIGPRRVSIDLKSAESASTGRKLPKTVIPLPYRNDTESRSLIAAGRIPSPWRDIAWDVDRLGPRRSEIFGPRRFDGSSLDSLGAVLCEQLESDARPRETAQLGAVVDALGVLRYEPAIDLLRSLVGQAVYAYNDLALARRCLRALSAIATSQSVCALMVIHMGADNWPSRLLEWASEELRTFDAGQGYLEAFGHA